MERKFALLAIGIAVALALVGNTIALLLDFPINFVTSIVTALVVGGFLALMLLRPPPGEADGFTVEEH